VDHPRSLIVELLRHFYTLGWVSGTGGGISVRDGGRVYMAPSGVQKERVREEDIFTLDLEGRVIEASANSRLRVSECAPLFLHAFRLRDAGAVLHSHSVDALLATLVWNEELRLTELEMIKGIAGHGYHDELVVPIIDNTAHERDLAEAMADAIQKYPRTHAVLVRRHGAYVWGRDWVQAKTHAECYDYLFRVALRMKELGIDPSVAQR